MKNPSTLRLVSLSVLAILAGSAPALAQTAVMPPFFPFMGQQQRPAAPTFPWRRPSQRSTAPGFALPWMQPRAAPRGSFVPPMSGMVPFAPGYSSGAFGMPGMSSGLGMMTAPMMQGMVGMMAPFAVNYMVASMNPTTMGNFFGLMSRPSGSGMGGFNPLVMMGGPMGGYGAPQPAMRFPFVQPPAHRPATLFPFGQPARPQPGRTPTPFSWPGSRPAPATTIPQRRTPARSPFPFPPFNMVGK